METLALDWSRLLKYNELNVNLYAARSAGVYRLSCQKGDERQVFYVGQGDNLYERLRDHSSDSESNACMRDNLHSYTCYFQFSPIRAQKDRDSAERALYDYYAPECNEVAPSAEPCNINFA